MSLLLGFTSVAALVGGFAAARPPVSVQFDRSTAKANAPVTVRIAGLPSGRSVRVYLVRRRIAPHVRSRDDPRLQFVGTVSRRRGRASLTFTVPPLPTGTYIAWCGACPRTGSGRRSVLRVTMPRATADKCPVTVPNGTVPPGEPPNAAWHGNGALWTALPPDGRVTVGADRVSPDGSLFWTKPVWLARGVDGSFDVRTQRLDAATAPLPISVAEGETTPFKLGSPLRGPPACVSPPRAAGR